MDQAGAGQCGDNLAEAVPPLVIGTFDRVRTCVARLVALEEKLVLEVTPSRPDFARFRLLEYSHERVKLRDVEHATRLQMIADNRGPTCRGRAASTSTPYDVKTTSNCSSSTSGRS